MAEFVEEKRENDSVTEDPPNGGHRFGVELGYNEYYWADAVRINEYGLMEWFCKYPNHDRYCKQTSDGVVMDYTPNITLEEFKKLPGGIE